MDSKQSDAIALAQQEAFTALDSHLQYFVSQYASGHTELSKLVRAENLSVAEHTAREILRSATAVQSHVTSELVVAENSITNHVNSRLEEATEQITSSMRHTNLEAVTQLQRERLLRSLKFPAMNERLNQVVESYESTFEWILRSRAASDNSASDDDTSECSSGDDDGFENMEQSIDEHVANSKAVESLSQRGISMLADDADSLSDDAGQLSDDSTSDQQTGEPILRHTCGTKEDDLWDNFGDWLKSDSTLYWISGKPGSGKSTLVKFLLGSPLTREALDVWKPDTAILSHFFWKPGSRMQKSIKGLLCTILHQALSEDRDALNVFLSSTPSLASKDVDTDWSFEELRAESIRILSSIYRPLCIFIDGLDEINDEDGATDLMRVINDIRVLANIKICVASRPEPRFEKLLRNEQRLQLQDLTAKDMKRYATGALRPYLDGQPSSPSLEHSVIYTLLYKADGVFLWLRLAIQSLIRGLENGDNGDVLLERLSLLPDELSQLYHDMWTRLNDDIPLYRKSAAQYFNLIMEADDIDTKIVKFTTRPNYSPYYGGGGCINIFQLMAATETTVQVTLLNQRSELDESRLTQLCECTQTAVKIRCAGLVEVQTRHTPHTPHTPTIEYYHGRHISVLPYLNTRVYFVHRTAYDYLRDSDHGHELRRYDESSRDDRIVSLMRAQLAQDRIFTSGAFNSVHRIMIPLSWIHHPNYHGTVEEILRISWDWYNLMHLRYSPDDKFIPNFLAVAAWTSFRNFVISNIANSPNRSTLAKEVLRDMMSLSWSHDYRLQAKLSEDLVSLHNILVDFLKPWVVRILTRRGSAVTTPWYMNGQY